MKILVVDDERAVRESLRRALELEGYEIELAADGREALYRLEGTTEPDAMILDVLMPGVDGLEVCRRLRDSGSKLPVLMLTARAEVESRVEGLDAGADDYVTKPFALDELLARVRALLRRTADEEGESGELLRFETSSSIRPRERSHGPDARSSSREPSSRSSSSSCATRGRC
jgi:two-component system response regulator MprA